MDDPRVYIKTNEESSNRIFNYGGDEDSNLLTKYEQMDMDYFIAITIPPLTRAQYTMLRNMHM